MKIATLNTWGTSGPPERQPVLWEALRSLQAEILCLQEVTDPVLLDRIGFPASCYAPASWLGIASRLPILESRVISYPVHSPLEPYQRELLLARLSIGENRLWIGTTHLAWKAEDEPSRLAQVEELIKETGPLQSQLLLAGDFNAAPEQEPIRRMREAGFQDLFAGLRPGQSGITWDNKNPFIQSHSVRFPDRRIDFLFLHEKTARWLEPTDCRVVCSGPTAVGLYPSDHYGVTATLS